VKLASLDPRVHRATLDHLDPKESRYLELLEVPVSLELPVRLDSKVFREVLGHRVRGVDREIKELSDLLDKKVRRVNLDSKDGRDKREVSDPLAVKVYVIHIVIRTEFANRLFCYCWSDCLECSS